MIEEVKMIMDEQTKRTVDSLRSSLEDVFAPLEKLPRSEEETRWFPPSAE